MKSGRRVTAVLGLVAAVIAGLISATAGVSAADPSIVTGWARGQGVQVNTLPATQIDLSRSVSEIDSSGIGVGTNVAAGSAKPAQVTTSGVVILNAADSDTSAPPPETENDGVPSVSLPGGLLSASALSSGSSADATPRSSNSARIAAASVLKPLIGPPLISTGVILGSSESRRVVDDALSEADASVANLGVNLLGLGVTVEGAVASATARATGIDPSLPGGSSAAVTNCVVAKVKIGLTTLLNIPCNGQELSPLPGVVSIRAGSPVASASTLSASASVDALTIFIPLTGQRIILGAVEIRAAVAEAAPTGPCPVPVPPAPASGSAEGDVVRLDEALTNLRADVALSQAEIDEAGVDGGGPYSAAADGIGAQVSQPDIPLLTQVADSHATAPPSSSDSVTVVDVSLPPLLTSATLATEADASAAPDGSAPAASASATAEEASLAVLAPVIDLDSTTVASDASTTRNPGDVTSAASASVEDTTGDLLGLPVDIQLLNSSATAFANGVAGGADTSTSYEIAYVQVGSLVIDETPAPGTVFEIFSGLTLIRLTFGVVSESTAPDGTTASASVDALVIEVLPGGGGALERITIGHSEATATVPVAVVGPGVMISKALDIHFDAEDSFGDTGATVAPGQKVKYLFCYTNTGATTLTNVVVRDQLHPRFRLPFASVFPLPPNVTVSNSNLLQTAPFTLAPGETGSFEVVVEVRIGTAVGTVIDNSATISANELGAPVTSNTVTFTVGYVTTQPALFSQVVNQSFNATTRVFTVNELLRNHASAGTAFDSRIETVGTTNGVGAPQCLPDPPG